MSDNNYESHYGDGVVVKDRTISPPNPEQYQDILKFSKCTNASVFNCTIVSGTEDCIDAVRGSGYTVLSCILEPRGTGGIEIKGAIYGCIITDISFKSHGTEYDIRLGMYDNYWYPGREKTGGVVISGVGSTSGRPVLVDVWDAEPPIVVNSNVRVVIQPRWKVLGYFIFRWLCQKIFGTK